MRIFHSSFSVSRPVLCFTTSHCVIIFVACRLSHRSRHSCSHSWWWSVYVALKRTWEMRKFFTPIMFSSIVFIDTPSHHHELVVVRHRWWMNVDDASDYKNFVTLPAQQRSVVIRWRQKSIIMMENTNSISLQYFPIIIVKCSTPSRLCIFRIISIESHFHYLLLFYL